MTEEPRKASAPPKRRNPEAVAAWRRGHRVEPPAKAYKRRPKHPKPRPDGGAFDFRGWWRRYAGVN